LHPDYFGGTSNVERRTPNAEPAVAKAMAGKASNAEPAVAKAMAGKASNDALADEATKV